MKYPTKLMVQGYPYALTFVSDPRDVDLSDPDSQMNGLCGDDFIRVSIKQTPLGVLDTAIHEVLHAIFNRTPMLGAAFRSEKMEEPFITTLATAVANVLVDNNLISLEQE
ncbi:MAG: hypothetical protein AMS22_12880 [Thiotrichales bacterium SG8_50]|nr:MAG: hypothetical protein AMS22_12880 [Thiotrichales bacterium SG8_50]